MSKAIRHLSQALGELGGRGEVCARLHEALSPIAAYDARTGSDLAGTLRAYIECYLKNHDQIHQGMTLLVRQLQPAGEGLPIEIYCFTSTTNWNAYEAIQADIFDHILAILPEFGLRVYQAESDFKLGFAAGDTR